MTDPNNRTRTFINALSHGAGEAVSAGLHVRLVLKGGEVVEGVPDAIAIDAEDVPPHGMPASDVQLYGAREETIQIGDSKILLEEVASFTLSLASATSD